MIHNKFCITSIYFCCSLLLMNSCNKASIPEASYQIIDRNSDIADALFASGDFILSTTENNEIVIINISKPDAQEVNKIWVAAFEDNINKQSYNRKLFDATLEVASDKRYLIIKNQNEQYFIALDEVENREKAKNITIASPNNTLSAAFCFGITYQWGHYDFKELLKDKTISAFESIRAANIKSNHTTDQSKNGAGEKCSSGGAGSTQCSIDGAFETGGCSITCTAGYYACCKSSSITCNCVKIKPGGVD